MYRVRHKSVNTPLFHERLVVRTWLAGNSAGVCQNFGISGGGINPPPSLSVRHCYLFIMVFSVVTNVLTELTACVVIYY
jgi:hypothetical protein